MNTYFLKKVLKTFVFTKHITLKKVYNLSLIGVQQSFLMNNKVIGHPIRLIIDPTSHCNLKCPLCPTGQGRMDRSRGFMKFEDFKKIVDENKDYLFEIDLYNWGEPFLNKEVYTMIAYAEHHNIKITTSSNLNILTDEMAENIVKSGLEYLTVSLDGASQDTYKIYRVGGNFDRVIENVRKIIHFKKKYNTKYPKIVWQFLIFRHNEHEIEKARAMAKQIGFDELNLRPMRSDMGQELKKSDAEKIEESKQWLPSTDKLSRYDYTKKKKKTMHKNCLFLWTQGVVNWNGSVAPCCAVYEEKNDFGNAFKEGSFLKVWNNRNYQKTREMIRNKQIIEGDICANCLKHGFIEY